MSAAQQPVPEAATQAPPDPGPRARLRRLRQKRRAAHPSPEQAAGSAVSSRWLMGRKGVRSRGAWDGSGNVCSKCSDANPGVSSPRLQGQSELRGRGASPVRGSRVRHLPGLSGGGSCGRPGACRTARRSVAPPVPTVWGPGPQRRQALLLAGVARDRCWSYRTETTRNSRRVAP